MISAPITFSLSIIFLDFFNPIINYVQARRKAEKEEKKRRKAEKEAKRAAKIAAMEAGEDKKEGGDGDEEDDDDLMYGAPDDHAWTDKSHAHKEAEEKAKEGPDMSVSHLFCAKCFPVQLYLYASLIYFLIHHIFITPPLPPTAHLRQGWQEAQQ